MIHLGLIGYPLGHSLSPTIHAAALKSCGLEGIYSLFPVLPDYRSGLQELLARVRIGEITGLNVTIPHKQTVIEFMDELTPTAKAIGAVNTIYLQDQKLIGDNTDAPGFLLELKRFLATKTRRPEELRALVLGAGGSARAVVYALLNDGWKVTIAARRTEQAKGLVESITTDQWTRSIPAGPITIYSLADLESNPTNLQFPVALIVNTTPVGMSPNIDRSPWPENLPFPPHAAIYDLVYNPHETKFVRDACAQGRLAMTGLGMLIEQAALAFEIWTGHKPSREMMLEAVNQITH